MTYNYCPLNWKLFRKKFVKLCVIFVFFLSNLLIQNEIGMPLDPVNTPWEYIPDKLGVQRDKFDGPIFDEHFNLQSVKLTFLSFFQYKVRILRFFTSYKMWNMFKVHNKDTRKPKVNNKVKTKDTVDVSMASVFWIYFKNFNNEINVQSDSRKSKETLPKTTLYVCMYVCMYVIFIYSRCFQIYIFK